MECIQLDWDDVILRTPKDLSWLLASLYIRGEVSEGFIERLRRGDSTAVSEARGIAVQYESDLKAIQALAGLSRSETRDRVWPLLIADRYPGVQTLKDLEEVRNSIRDTLIQQLSEPIVGTIEFVRCASRRGLGLGIVSQARETDILEPSRLFHLPLEIFSHIECAGDYRGNVADPKTAAYAAICRRFGVPPHSTVAFEDSNSGVICANRAGLVSIGVKDELSHQDLPDAAFVIESHLGALADDEALDVIQREPPYKAIIVLSTILEKKGVNTRIQRRER